MTAALIASLFLFGQAKPAPVVGPHGWIARDRRRGRDAADRENGSSPWPADLTPNSC